MLGCKQHITGLPRLADAVLCCVVCVCGSSGRGLHMQLAMLLLVCFLLSVLLLSGFLLESSDSNALSQDSCCVQRHRCDASSCVRVTLPAKSLFYSSNSTQDSPCLLVFSRLS